MWKIIYYRIDFNILETTAEIEARMENRVIHSLGDGGDRRNAFEVLCSLVECHPGCPKEE